MEAVIKHEEPWKALGEAEAEDYQPVGALMVPQKAEEAERAALMVVVVGVGEEKVMKAAVEGEAVKKVMVGGEEEIQKAMVVNPPVMGTRQNH